MAIMHARMDLLSLLPAFAPLDWIALALFLGLWVAIGYGIESPPGDRTSVTAMMKAMRMAWMREFANRENRIFDSQILGNLRQGTAFFASTMIIAIGGVLGFASNAAALRAAASLLGADEPVAAAQVKLLLVALILTNAFLRFVWANRVFGYCSVVMGAVPEPSEKEPNMHSIARQAGALNVQAALNFNRGLRALYFALAGLAWLAGPWALMVATGFATYTLLRREFASHTHAILTGEEGGLRGDEPPPDQE